MFGRATITLGIGPHFQLHLYCVKAKFHYAVQLASRSQISQQTSSSAGSLAGQCNGIWQILLRSLGRDLARELVRELVCDLLSLNSIMLSRLQTWSQTWFPTCHRQVRAIWTCRDSSNLVADRFRPYSTTLSCSLAGRRPVRELVASWTV